MKYEVNKFYVTQGQDAELPFMLTDAAGAGVYLTPYWVRLSAKFIKKDTTILTKTSDDSNQLFVFYAGPPAFFIIRLTPADILLFDPAQPIDVIIYLETNLTGFKQRVYSYPKAITVAVPTIAV